MWLSASNKDLFSFDFVRAANKWIREHRRCDDSRGTLISALEGPLENQIAVLQQRIVEKTNRVAALESDLEFARTELTKDQEALEALEALLVENNVETLELAEEEPEPQNLL